MREGNVVKFIEFFLPEILSKFRDVFKKFRDVS